MRAMQKTRRSWALAAGALLLAAPLSSCGFDNATERVYTPAAGANNRDATVDVLGAVIVSAEEGSGTFVATFVNNDQVEDGVVEGITPDDEAIQIDFSPVTVPPATPGTRVPEAVGVGVGVTATKVGPALPPQVGAWPVPLAEPPA